MLVPHPFMIYVYIFFKIIQGVGQLKNYYRYKIFINSYTPNRSDVMLIGY